MSTYYIDHLPTLIRTCLDGVFLICDQKGNVVNFAYVPNQQHSLRQFMHAHPEQHLPRVRECLSVIKQKELGK